MAAVAAACGGDNGMGGLNHDMNRMESIDMGAMDMSDDMNGTSDGDMGAMPGMEPIPDAGVPATTESQGALPLSHALDGDVKVFALTARAVRWKLTGDVTMTAWTNNGTVPGPMIRVTEGDKVRVTVKTNSRRRPVWVGFILEERDLLETSMTLAIPASLRRSHPASFRRSAPSAGY